MSAEIIYLHGAPKQPHHSGRIGWVVAENGCHLWQGAVNHGYGMVWVGDKMRAVYRVRYENEVGPVPQGMHLDHFVCDNRLCCNPHHVRPVSPRENALRSDSISARHLASETCKRGHSYTPDNLAPWALARGFRRCIACDKLRYAAFRERRKTLLAGSN